jgi:hypothetical protein
MNAKRSTTESSKNFFNKKSETLKLYNGKGRCGKLLCVEKVINKYIFFTSERSIIGWKRSFSSTVIVRLSINKMLFFLKGKYSTTRCIFFSISFWWNEIRHNETISIFQSTFIFQRATTGKHMLPLSIAGFIIVIHLDPRRGVRGRKIYF